ncbi:MAG: hypothetical protein ABI573_01640 [Chloroflexota bacterium]
MTIIQTSGAVIGFVLCLPFVVIWVVLAMIRGKFGRQDEADVPVAARQGRLAVAAPSRQREATVA